MAVHQTLSSNQRLRKAQPVVDLKELQPRDFFVGISQSRICIHLTHPNLHLLVQHQIHSKDFLGISSLARNTWCHVSSPAPKKLADAAAPGSWPSIEVPIRQHLEAPSDGLRDVLSSFQPNVQDLLPNGRLGGMPTWNIKEPWKILEGFEVTRSLAGKYHATAESQWMSMNYDKSWWVTMFQHELEWIKSWYIMTNHVHYIDFAECIPAALSKLGSNPAWTVITMARMDYVRGC